MRYAIYVFIALFIWVGSQSVSFKEPNGKGQEEIRLSVILGTKLPGEARHVKEAREFSF